MSDDESSSSASSGSGDDQFLVAKSKNKHRTPSDSENDEADATLQINQKYAREYDVRKRREELTNFRQLEALEAIGQDVEDESDESESEDEDGELLTADMDVKIIKTLRALKRKEEGIYDRNVTFFSESNEDIDNGGADGRKDGKVKPKRYKDVVREHILEEMEANEEVSRDQAGNGVSRNGAHDLDGHDLAYDQEQKEIRRAFLESTRDSETEKSEESEEENWLKPKPKKNADSDENQDELKKLWEQEFSTSEETKLVDPKGEVQDGDKFLMDFMTNRKWVDASENAMKKMGDDDNDSIESFQDRMDDFESKYNFRFEEAAANNNEESGATHSIVHYARGSVGDNVLRRKDETRRQKRLARKERKAEERKAKEEQLRRLKNAKREELEERLRQVRNVLGYDALNGDGDASGNHALGAAEEEMILKLMEGDYDPEKFEQVMNAAYGEDFYQKEDEKWKTDLDVKDDLAKGVEDSDVLGDGDMYDDTNEEIEDEETGEVYPEDGGAVDDAYDEEEEQWETEQYPAEESGIEKKLKSKMMDELYKLDYEDIIGDMPTRFKYRSVEPNNYGLTTEEILMAKDTTLKQFVSLKKMAPYRDEGEYQPGTKKRKRFRQMLKTDKAEMMKSDKLDDSNAGANEQEEGADSTRKKRRRQKKGSKKNSGSIKPDSEKDRSNDESPNLPIEDLNAGEKKRKSKKNMAAVLDSSTEKAANTVSDGVSESKETKPKKEKTTDRKDKGKYFNKGDEGRKKKRKRSIGVDGVSAARLASYGI
ncbi:hypothetical protein HJC23_000036 [Cyclotella cryptica]|uniref:Kri1-like C-terminal domain-containing protein n=1 Tax=Cyclotella cryptica TaxID=29204 RepID=A0ABD3P2D4_9STRA|eukprot:CCRYP_018415-RA/>CCRYP_018415-RA protein AED:0.01 eAED:0.01 QI:262/1/1/1/1/1/2/227/767